MIRDFNVRGFVLLLRLVVIAVSVAGFGGSTAAQARQEKKEPAALPVPESKLAEKSKQFESLAPSIEIRNVTIEKSEYGMIFRVTVRNLVDEGVLAYCFYLRGSDPDSGAFTSAFKPLRPEAQEFAIGPLAEQGHRARIRRVHSLLPTHAESRPLRIQSRRRRRRRVGPDARLYRVTRYLQACDASGTAE